MIGIKCRLFAGMRIGTWHIGTNRGDKVKRILHAVVVASLPLILGCSSVPHRMGALPSREYEVVGRGKASAGGFMLFHFIPIRHNGKIQRAYSAAVRRSNGDDLINPTISERWFWAYVGNGYRTTIEGDVIKYKE